jgi:exopolyphosphatase/guanosine-5'-triphosphate,3'-diphosphate pyrophosphatase
VLVTSPGRQAANGDTLLAALERAAHVPVRLLTAEDEGALAFAGALELSGQRARRLVAVCDVGGGSSQIAIGTREGGASWIRSIDIGSMRLTSRLLSGDPPGVRAVERAKDEVHRYVEGLVPPLPKVALAVGGTARSLRGVVGGTTLGHDELAFAIDVLARTPVAEIAARYGVEPARARTMAAGAVILDAIRGRLGVSLRISRGGVRQGAALALERRPVAA